MKKFIISLIVLFTAVFLTVSIAPFGIIYAIIISIYNRSLSYFSKVILRIAVSLDQLGNVICGDLLNIAFLQSKNPMYYLFGKEDDTVSEILAKNNKVYNLTRFGRVIAYILEKIDPGHLESALTENE